MLSIFQMPFNLSFEIPPVFIFYLKEFFWVIAAVYLFSGAKFIYLWWLQERWGEKEIKPIMLEVKVPEEVAKTPKAMEQIFYSFWSIYDPPNFREKWLDGKFLLSFSCEIASIDGQPHFFLRIPKNYKKLFESAIYSQYSEAEIVEVEDYTKNVPKDIPNKEWDIWGCDFQFVKPDPYPIRTFAEFEEERQSEMEKRIDPISSFLEGASKLKKGEQLWLQIVACPVTESDGTWVKEGKEIINQLMGKAAAAKSENFLIFLIKGVINIFVYGKLPGGPEKKEEKIDFGALRLSPRDQEIVKEMGRKISKYAFKCTLRFAYIGKREIFFKPTIRIPLSFFNGFGSLHLNIIKPLGATITKIAYILIDRRTYLRKRKLFKNYIMRVPPFFPHGDGRVVLNTEELATIYHFPGRMVAPSLTLERVESKKGGPPPGLPTE